MKSKLVFTIAVLCLLGLSIAVYAYNSIQTTTEAVATACCCCPGDSCPIKSADVKAAGETSHKCCCGGDSCPMKSKDGKAAGSEHSCCGDSCPLKSKDSAASCPMMQDAKNREISQGMKHSADGKSGCCPCCDHHKVEGKKDNTGV